MGLAELVQAFYSLCQATNMEGLGTLPKSVSMSDRVDAYLTARDNCTAAEVKQFDERYFERIQSEVFDLFA